MPYMRCTCCGSISHVSVGNVEQWYKDHYPTVPFGQMVPGRCFLCWQELKVGDEVILRKVIGEGAKAEVGDRGVIESILQSEYGDLYVVKLLSGAEQFFVRPELRAVRVQEEDRSIRNTPSLRLKAKP